MKLRPALAPIATAICLVALWTLSGISAADARGGGITGFQGAGAAIGGGPIGANQRPSYSGRSIGYEDGRPACTFRRDYYGRVVQVCE